MSNDLLIAGIVGISAGVVSSLVFALGLRLFVPNIVICPNIARHRNNRGEILYYIKVINRTRWHLKNMRGEFYWAERSNLPILDEKIQREKKGAQQTTLRTLTEIPLRRPRMMIVRRRFRADVHDLYVFRFTANEEVVESLKPSDPHVRERPYLYFRVYAEHGFSGASKVVEKDFLNPYQLIQDGDFAGADDCTITPEFVVSGEAQHAESATT